MAGVNQFSPFGLAPGANVLTATSWQALTARQNGFSSGLANSTHCNTAWRQASSWAAVLGQFVADRGLSALDDGDLGTLQANFEAAILGLTGGSIGDTERIHTGQDVGSVNTILANVSPNVTSYGFLSYYLIRIANTNTAGAVVNLNSVGVKPLVRFDGTGLQERDVLGGSVVAMVYDGNVFRLLAPAQGETPKIIPGGKLYIKRSTGNDSANGLTPDTALKTIDAAFQAAKNFYITGDGLTFQLLETGEYPFPVNYPVMGGPITIRGDEGAQGSYVLSGAGNPSGGRGGIVEADRFNITLIGLTVRNTSTSKYTVAASAGASLTLSYVTLTSSGPITAPHVYATAASSVTIFTGCSWQTSAAGMIRSGGGTIFIGSGAALSVANGVAWSDAAVTIITFGSMTVRGSATITGTATGLRYRTIDGILNVSGLGPNFFPGDQPGTSTGAGGYSS